MPGLGETTATIRRYRAALAAAKAAAPGVGDRQLVETKAFGANPGRLRMLSYAPQGLEKPALVVVLHGCTQTAAGYQHGAGWGTLADRYGFALLCPEQRLANNPNRCFNWFQPDDTRRDSGEAASIRQMIDRAIDLYGVDPDRIYVTGLSAGGAMTATLLAAYPEIFAGGAIIAGLPHGAAANVQEAFGAMMQPQSRASSVWGDLVRAASPGPASHRGWPAVSIWHGDADATVVVANAEEIVKQWRDVHGLTATAPAEMDQDGAWRSQVWRSENGKALVSSYTITGMGHGAPLATDGEDGVGTAGPFLLEVGISSSLRIAGDWGLIGERRPAPKPAPLLAPEPHRDAGLGGLIRKALASIGLGR